MKIAFLCSGAGGNLAFIHHAARGDWVRDVDICGVFADRECRAADYAREQGLHVEVLDFSAAGQSAAAQRIAATEPDLVVTTVNRILTPAFVQAFRGRLINLHYSLLPAFAGRIGAAPLVLALERGVKLVGVTVHEVDEGVDTGRPLAQAVTSVGQTPEVPALMHVLFRAGCLALLDVIAQRCGAHAPADRRSILSLAGHAVMFSPALAVLAPAMDSDSTWSFLA